MALKRILMAACGALALFALVTPSAMADTDVKKEIATAEAHAGFAAGGADLKAVQMHLHHVVNCLVGPKGKGFDASQANPCKDQGNGVMPDYKGKQKKALQQALDTTRAGLKATDLAVAKQKASDAEMLLKKVM